MMIRENRNILDPVGWIGAFFEWFASYLLSEFACFSTLVLLT